MRLLIICGWRKPWKLKTQKLNYLKKLTAHAYLFSRFLFRSYFFVVSSSCRSSGWIFACSYNEAVKFDLNNTGTKASISWAEIIPRCWLLWALYHVHMLALDILTQKVKHLWYIYQQHVIDFKYCSWFSVHLNSCHINFLHDHVLSPIIIFIL